MDALNKSELRIKLENLERQSIDIGNMKKAAAKDYNDQLKENREEILEVLEDLEECDSE